MTFSLIATLLGLAALATAAPMSARTPFTFETAAEMRLVRANNTKVATVPSGGARKQALEVIYQPVEWPNVTFSPETPWDWSGTGGLALEVTNPGAEPVSFGVRVDDDPKADGVTHCRTGNSIIAAHETATFLMPFGQDPMAVGMRGLPAPAGVRGIGAGGSGPFELRHIVQFQVFVHAPKRPTTLRVDNIRLVPPLLHRT